MYPFHHLLQNLDVDQALDVDQDTDKAPNLDQDKDLCLEFDQDQYLDVVQEKEL